MITIIKEIIIGCLLGDAHIRKTKNNKAYLTFEQSIIRKDYLLYIFSFFVFLNYKDPVYYERKDNKYNKINTSIYFRTKSLEEFNLFAELFLNEKGKKIIPNNIEEYLTFRSLAFWIMDDGQQVKKGGVTLCTDNYTLREVNVLRKALENKFNIKTTIHFKKGKNEYIYYRIYITKHSLESIKSFLIPYFHSSLLYKIHVN